MNHRRFRNKLLLQSRLGIPMVCSLLATAVLGAIAQTTPAHPKPESNGNAWWSLKPLSKPKPPVSTNPQSSNPIDSFVLAKLKEKKLSLAPPADRATLIRRVTFDLIGLPPTPAEIDAFVRDKSPNAYEKLVDRLLTDPRYGERWGRHWLDVARFGESNGFERDQFRPNAWRYRDYVINAFNSDKPYDQFIREQIAGDVMQPQTAEGIVATGFLVCGPWDEVGSTQVSALMRARVREEEMEEMIGTVSQTFLGLTANCARCHDHKFDPIPQRDYYRIKSALEGVHGGDRTLVTMEKQKALDGEIRLKKAEMAKIQEQLADIERSARTRIAKGSSRSIAVPTIAPLARWTFENGAQDSSGSLNGSLEGGAKVANGRLILNGNGAFLRSAPLPKTVREKTLEAWIYLPDLAQRGGAIVSLQTPDGVQFDAITFGERQPGKWAAGSEAFHRTRDLDAPAETTKPGTLVHVATVYKADGTIAVYRDGVLYGQAYNPVAAGLREYPAGGSEVLIGLRHKGAGNGFLRGEVEEARLYNRALTAEEIAGSFRAGIENVSEAEIDHALTQDERDRRKSLQGAVRTSQLLIDTANRPELTWALNASQPAPTHILARGDVESRGEIVSAGGLSCVVSSNPDFALAPDSPEANRRLKLAEWISDPRNPLMARVIVNRVWHYHFGRGMVGTPNDFGINGDTPSHPELLDWLASTFVSKPESPSSPNCGFSIKKLHKLILLSNTYRQSSTYSAAAAGIDSDDRLLWRFPPHRLEGEAVRDAMLSVSGQLNPQRGGPSFQPFKIVIDNSTFYQQFDSGAPEYNRRTVYRAGVNSAKNAMLETLDCPDPSTKTPKRAVTTTPLQALELMNNSFVLRQSEELAKRLQREAGMQSVSMQIPLAYRLAFGREPSPAELKKSGEFIKGNGLSSFCWTLLNSSEFLYVR